MIWSLLGFLDRLLIGFGMLAVYDWLFQPDFGEISQRLVGVGLVALPTFWQAATAFRGDEEGIAGDRSPGDGQSFAGDGRIGNDENAASDRRPGNE